MGIRSNMGLVKQNLCVRRMESNGEVPDREGGALKTWLSRRVRARF